MSQPLREDVTRRASPRAVPAIELERALRQAASGDGESWRWLVETYSGRVYGLLYRQTGDRELAEELAQATFAKLVVKLADFDGYTEQGRFEPWLLRVAMNGLRDEMRRRKRQATPMDMSPSAGSGRDESDAAWAGAQQRVVLGGPGAAEDPAELASRAEQIDRLRAAVEGMSEADREVLHLRHTSGLSFAEIAATLDQPLGTVLARAHRALGKLRKLMEESGMADKAQKSASKERSAPEGPAQESSKQGRSHPKRAARSA